MPPAFNLSQDQTLQFNLAILLQVLSNPQISLKANLHFCIFDQCEVLLICLELTHFAVAKIICLHTRTHTNRLFFLSFKELFSSSLHHRGSEEVRIIET